MLADPRATDALVDDFAAQWLNLRRVDEVVVDPDRYPNYDESLLQAFQQETELFVGSTLREDRSVARSAATRTTRSSTNGWRGTTAFPASTAAASAASRCRTPISAAGCSAQGALLATTSYPDRTSPVLRGKWLLNNIFGLPVPPPPPGVDTNLPENKPGAAPPIDPRAAGAAPAESRRATAVIRSIDPLGFALENFDVIGGWRTIDESGKPVDASGTHGERREGRGAVRDCGRCCSSSPSSFPARSPKSCWPTRSAAGSSTTIGRRCARSSATRRRTTTAGRRSFWES